MFSVSSSLQSYDTHLNSSLVQFRGPRQFLSAVYVWIMRFCECRFQFCQLLLRNNWKAVVKPIWTTGRKFERYTKDLGDRGNRNFVIEICVTSLSVNNPATENRNNGCRQSRKTMQRTNRFFSIRGNLKQKIVSDLGVVSRKYFGNDYVFKRYMSSDLARIWTKILSNLF